MALSKAFVTNFGVTALYWKIANVTEDFIANTMKIVMAGYVSAEARQAGAQPLAAMPVELAGEGYTPERDRAALYAVLKTSPQWADAEDC